MSSYLSFLMSTLYYGAYSLFIALAPAVVFSVFASYFLSIKNLGVFIQIIIFSLLFYFGVLSPIHLYDKVNGWGSGGAGLFQLPSAVVLGVILLFSTVIIAPALGRKQDANKYRALSLFGVIAFAVAPLLYYALNIILPLLLGPAVAFASFLFMGAGERIEKAGLWTITNDNYSKKEIHFAALIYARETIAPLFLLIFGALVWSGFYLSVYKSLRLYSETFTGGGGYLWGYGLSFAAAAYMLLISLVLSLFFGSMKYFQARNTMNTMLGLVLDKNRGSSIRGAKKNAGDLQSSLDKQ